MTKVEALKKLLKKISGVDSHEDTIAGVINELSDNYSGGSLVMKTSNYTTTGETTEIPINISSFNKNTDILFVYINGLKAIENTKYTISSDSSKITLTSSILADQVIEFVVIKNE